MSTIVHDTTTSDSNSHSHSTSHSAASIQPERVSSPSGILAVGAPHAAGIVITHIHPVGVYKFVGVAGDICAICRNELTSLCGGCSIETDGETICRITKGICGHMMHEHCVNEFQRVTQNDTCVTCRAQWVLTEVIDINAVVIECDD